MARTMLSIAKLRVGQEAYHLSGVAQSLDDYYTGAGEAAGWWVGGGAGRLGLKGEVDADALRARHEAIGGELVAETASGLERADGLRGRRSGADPIGRRDVQIHAAIPR